MVPKIENERKAAVQMGADKTKMPKGNKRGLRLLTKMFLFLVLPILLIFICSRTRLTNFCLHELI